MGSANSASSVATRIESLVRLDAHQHFWRFTPEGLVLLCKRYSEIIDVGGWGNMYVWFVVWLGLHDMPVPLCRWHPLHWVAMRNDDNWKIVTWIVAKK